MVALVLSSLDSQLGRCATGRQGSEKTILTVDGSESLIPRAIQWLPAKKTLPFLSTTPR